ncbi:MAG TPA: hypothetical protein VIV15_04640, partial [Anaerolineales bacterium]
MADSDWEVIGQPSAADDEWEIIPQPTIRSGASSQLTKPTPHGASGSWEAPKPSWLQQVGDIAGDSLERGARAAFKGYGVQSGQPMVPLRQTYDTLQQGGVTNVPPNSAQDILIKGASQLAEGLTTPGNALAAGGTMALGGSPVVAKIANAALAGIFAPTMLSGGGQQLQQGVQRIQQGDAGGFSDVIAGLGMGYMGSKSAEHLGRMGAGTVAPRWEDYKAKAMERYNQAHPEPQPEPSVNTDAELNRIQSFGKDQVNEAYQSAQIVRKLEERKRQDLKDQLGEIYEPPAPKRPTMEDLRKQRMDEWAREIENMPIGPERDKRMFEMENEFRREHERNALTLPPEKPLPFSSEERFARQKADAKQMQEVERFLKTDDVENRRKFLLEEWDRLFFEADRTGDQGVIDRLEQIDEELNKLEPEPLPTPKDVVEQQTTLAIDPEIYKLGEQEKAWSAQETTEHLTGTAE